MTNKEARKILLSLDSVYINNDEYTCEQYERALNKALVALSEVERYKKALNMAAFDFEKSSDCKGWCSLTAICNAENKAQTSYGCMKFVLEHKKEAGIYD